MITFRNRTCLESVKRWWPPYRRKRDAEMYESLRQLVANPDLPCIIGDHYIPNGHGSFHESSAPYRRF